MYKSTTTPDACIREEQVALPGPLRPSSVHANVHARTYNSCIYTQYVQGQTYTRGRTIDTPAHAQVQKYKHSCTLGVPRTVELCTRESTRERTIGTPLHVQVQAPTYILFTVQVVMLNTVHVQVQALTCTRCTAQAAHAEHGTSTSIDAHVHASTYNRCVT